MIKTNFKGVLYELRGKWVGPFNQEIVTTEKEASELLAEARQRTRRRCKVARMCWETSAN